MKVINIGRSSKNDVCIDDRLVSRTHCQIIQDDNGQFLLIDCNSANGTFINGLKRHGQVRLKPTDIVRIGNTTLPWQNYFYQSTLQIPDYQPHSPHPEPAPIKDPTPIQPVGRNLPQQISPLGAIALILSLVGIGLVIYSVFLLVSYGFIAFLVSSPYKYIIGGIGCSILSFILALIADYQNNVNNEDYDGDICITIAETLSSITILTFIGFWIYIAVQS